MKVNSYFDNSNFLYNYFNSQIGSYFCIICGIRPYSEKRNPARAAGLTDIYSAMACVNGAPVKTVQSAS